MSDQGISKAEALITAVEESAILYKKMAEIIDRYQRRSFKIFLEEHTYIVDFLGELLGLLKEVNEPDEAKQAKYLLDTMIKAQKRILKSAEILEKEME